MAIIHASRRYGLPVMFAALAVIAGCRGAREAEAPVVTEIAAYGMVLTSGSEPDEVVKMLIAGLDNRDEELLAKLVAVRDTKQEVDAIFRKHTGGGDTTLEQAAGFAVSGWLMTYALFEPGRTSVSRGEVSGDTATVIATGRNRATGKSHRLKIELLREDGWWKVRAGINTL